MKFDHEASVLISILGGSRAVWIKSCDLRLDVCGFSVTLGKFFSLPKTKFLHLYNGNNSLCSALKYCCEDLMDETYVKYLPSVVKGAL